LGKVNFLRRFVSNIVELVNHIKTMLRKGNEVKWTVDSRDYFNQIKEAHMLIIPDYSKGFLIVSFDSFDTIAVILLQKNAKGLEEPISFFSRALRDTEIKYDIMVK
jgi:hypothetical protein